tara:strand:+ start:465 stop:923 length:459 start_codon:yes stop_codon:yes gene_type:complete
MILPNDLIPYSFIFIAIIFLLAVKKNKINIKNQNKIEDTEIKSLGKEIKREILENSESKLKALKDLYHQDLIDSKIYLSKSEIIAKNLSKEIGEDIMHLPKVQQKVIFSDLKKEIKKKIFNDVIKHDKTNIDNLILAVDDKIKKESINNEEK